jgi:hypothetical protein
MRIAFASDKEACLDFSESYYIHDVRYFKAEEEALTWLRNQ